MLRIKDIMTQNVYTVEADASAAEAAWGLTCRHIGGAPARDTEGNLVGVIVTPMDVVLALSRGQRFELGECE